MEETFNSTEGSSEELQKDNMEQFWKIFKINNKLIGHREEHSEQRIWD